ncbi:MAG: hypothetical protein R2940_09005 [Syntrophotaleaceae bacterium]
MKKTAIAFVLLLLSGSVMVLPAGAQNEGSRLFGCIELQWRITGEGTAIRIEFLKKGESFGSLFLNDRENFRQFSFAAESVFIEGRIRAKYDPENQRGILRADSITYRCYSPRDQWFSGEITQFELPENSGSER